MKIAATMAPGRGDTDLLLFTLAERLRKRGLEVCGTVQVNTERPDNHPCDMDIQVLPAGPLLRISQNLGAGSKGCRLNPEGLETAVGLVGASMSKKPDALIINKFGKQEAQGGGFRNVIADALFQDIPVLVGLNRLNEEAFQTFAGDMAVILPPDIDRLEQWLLEQIDCQADQTVLRSQAAKPPVMNWT